MIEMSFLPCSHHIATLGLGTRPAGRSSHHRWPAVLSAAPEFQVHEHDVTLDDKLGSPAHLALLAFATSAELREVRLGDCPAGPVFGDGWNCRAPSGAAREDCGLPENTVGREGQMW